MRIYRQRIKTSQLSTLKIHSSKQPSNSLPTQLLKNSKTQKYIVHSDEITFALLRIIFCRASYHISHDFVSHFRMASYHILHGFVSYFAWLLHMTFSQASYPHFRKVSYHQIDKGKCQLNTMNSN